MIIIITRIGGTVRLMEIIMISECKLKVMLCEDDLKSFEIKADQLDYANTETKRMFWDILNRAKHQTGFDTDGQRVLVQLYPSKEGGCEMFVTKIGMLETTDGEGKKHRCEEKSQSRSLYHKKCVFHKAVCSAFGFMKLSSLLEVCRRLLDIGYIGESSAYSCDNGMKYLILSDVDVNEAPNEFSFITEYATCENALAIGYFISEHGKAICENDAVSVLSKF